MGERGIYGTKVRLAGGRGYDLGASESHQIHTGTTPSGCAKFYAKSLILGSEMEGLLALKTRGTTRHQSPPQRIISYFIRFHNNKSA